MKFWRHDLHLLRLNISAVRNDTLVAICPKGSLKTFAFDVIHDRSARLCGFVITLHFGNYFLNIDWV